VIPYLSLLATAKFSPFFSLIDKADREPSFFFFTRFVNIQGDLALLFVIKISA
jgi:hypothetical protein